jgi:hypothetical protein
MLTLVQCESNSTGNTDSEQAEKMLTFLKNVSESESKLEMIDAILETRGMDLIIEQQNKMATINKAQYRILLLSLQNEEMLEIEPVDSSVRAKLGVQRLKNNVAPALKWAIENVDLLEDRLTFLNDLDIGSQAKALADSFLPEPLRSIPTIFFVIGGRAGYYAGDECIYMDLLNMSYSPKGVKPFVESDIIDFFAHEMHHVGYGDLSKSKRSQLRLNKGENRAFGLISGLVAEGSATFLINGHRDLDLIRNNRRYVKYYNLENDLREICESILHSILSGQIQDDDEYSDATEPLLGMGYHAAGAIITNIIYQTGGLEAIMRVLSDPRLFLKEYNRAAESMMNNSDSDTIYLFDDELVNVVANMGQ